MAKALIVSEAFATTLRRTFEGLAAEWEADTLSSSSVREICTHPAYQRIIGLGSDVVPFVLERVAAGEAFWDWALSSITGENPAAGTETIEDASQAWLEWGRRRGLINAAVPV